MKIEQIYTGCLAHAAYYVENNGEAAIFDPLREVQPYIDRAKKDKAKIKYVFETHFHADFVSGHLDLAKKTGAKIVYGPTAHPKFKAIIAQDKDIFNVGNYKIKVLHTPGHTLESTTYLLIDENGVDHGIITGDTLFIGDVGRPDLAQHVVKDLTERRLAGMLYESLHEKIIPLNDNLIVYPNHGAGSACGKMMSTETVDTLGHQKETNYALQPMEKEEFINKVLEGLTPPPRYFPDNVLMNIQGYEDLDTIIKRAETPLDPDAFEAAANETGALVIDTRNAEEFAKGFIPNSINIGLNGNLAMWAGEMIPDIQQKILLVCDEGSEEEAMIRLSRVGFDHTIGYLFGGFESWKDAGKDIEHIVRIDAATLAKRYPDVPEIIDVRKESEFKTEHIINAINIPLNRINENLASFPKNKAFVIHCAGGYRSMLAASILKARGWSNFVDVRGGLKAIKDTNIPVTDFVYPTTQL